MPPLTKQDLDRTTAMGCQAPDHLSLDQTPGKTTYIHFRCHINAPAFMMKYPDRPDALEYKCVHPECEKGMTFSVTGENLEGRFRKGLFAQDCHPDSAVWLSYTNGTGKLVVHCYEGEKVVGESTWGEAS